VEFAFSNANRTALESAYSTIHDSFRSTIVADDGSFRLGEPPNGAPSSTWASTSHTFTQTGTFGYHCEVHGAPNGVGMAGVVIVQAASPTTSIYLPLVVK
jgi:hypothetical protein